MSGGTVSRCSVLVVGVGRYERGPDRERAAAAAAAFVDAFGDRRDHVVSLRLVSPTATEQEVEAAIVEWGGGSPEVGLLLWTGHAELEGRAANVILSDSYAEASTLAAWVARQRFPRLLVIVDSCYGEVVIDNVNNLLDDRQRRGHYLVSSTDATMPANAGTFTSQLTAVLAPDPGRPWSSQDAFLETWDVLALLGDSLQAAFEDPPVVRGANLPGRCFPNPYYEPRAYPVALDEAHFLPKARGIEAGEPGWYFTGRVDALRRIVDWLASGSGLLVVSGSAGTGKSAVLGRVITFGVEALRSEVPPDVLAAAPPGTIPPLGSLDAAFHARDRRADELLGFLARALDVPDARDVDDIAKAVAGRRPTIVVDALDEAGRGHGRRMVAELLAPLARSGAARVLVASRPGVVDWGPGYGVDGDHVVELDRQPGTRDDIEAYVKHRLLGIASSSYRSHPELAAMVASEVAAKSLGDTDGSGREVGNFLVARILSRLIASRPLIEPDGDWRATIPSGFEEAFAADLADYRRRLGVNDASKVEAVLEGLAWDEGQGIPRRLIPTIVRAVTGLELDADDVAMVLREAAGHIVETSLEGWAAYRLYHERLREHLRATTRARRDQRDDG